MFWCAPCAADVRLKYIAKFASGEIFSVFKQISLKRKKGRGFYPGANCAGALIAQAC
jgi:hypothetical protein